MGLFRKKHRGNEAERRRAERVDDRRAVLVIGGVSYGVLDWSVEDFRVLGYRGGYQRGQEAEARLIVVHNNLPVHFDAVISVVHENAETGELAGRFVEMSATTRHNLDHIHDLRLARQHEEADEE